jgi:N-acetylmuramic acid 6-phosphate etherase
MSTERRNPRSVDIDLFPTERILKIINQEDALIATAVATAIPEIAKVVDLATETIRIGGRVIYVGAGTSGRLAMLDAVECRPTFSTPSDWFEAILAGGSKTFANAKESAEDDREQATADVKAKKVVARDLIIGIAASGKTPYTLAAMEFARSLGAKIVAIVTVPGSPMSKIADITVFTEVGPEIITGSTRMKAGTAQKLVMNMISTTTMIRLGMTYGNWMINVGMTNQKLRDRGMQILREILGLHDDELKKLIDKSGGNLKVAVVMGALACDRKKAEKLLQENGGNLRKIVAHLGSGRE